MSRVERGRIGATRGKLVVVGLLAAALVGVVAKNFHGASPRPAVEVAPVATVPAARPVAPSKAAAPTERGPALPASPFGKFADDVVAPAYSLERLIRFDPLAAPAWMAATEQSAGAVGPHDQTFEELQAAQNAIILVTGNHRVARIGAQEYRVGDMVGRYQITDISSAGIVLSLPTRDANAAE
jgi:hypothetical protein